MSIVGEDAVFHAADPVSDGHGGFPVGDRKNGLFLLMDAAAVQTDHQRDDPFFFFAAKGRLLSQISIN